MREILIEFGKRLRKARTAAGLSQGGLAHRASLRRNYVGRLERGQENPTLLTFERLATTLQIPIARLIPSNVHQTGPAPQP